MLKYTKILLFILMPCLTSAQSVSVSPYSFKAWGDIKATTMISAEYKMIGLHGIYVHQTHYSQVGNVPTPDYVFGVSVMSPRIEDILRGGIMYFTENFPTPTDTQLNAFVEASYKIKGFRIFYRHISNAGTGTTNHGMDYVGLTIHL